MSVSQAYEYLYLGALIVIAICVLFVIIKSIVGPRISDRIVTINMVGTLVTSSIMIFAIYLANQKYLLDICIIYVLLSFLSVIVLCNVFINQYLENKKKEGK